MSVFAQETQASSGQTVDLSSTDWTPTGVARGIIVGTAGNITGRLSHDATDQVYPVAAGVPIGLKFKIIRKTGTTAAQIVALY